MNESAVGLDLAKLKLEIDEINKLANQVYEYAEELKRAANSISNEGIRGMDWYNGAFESMLKNLKENKALEVKEEILKEGAGLYSASEAVVYFSKQQ